MADLPTNYLDDILAQSMNGKRKYRITRADGTFEEVILEDVSEYEQVGSNFGASDINKTNQAVNEKFDSGDVVDPMLTTEEGFAADAYKTKLQFDEQNKNFGGLKISTAQVVLDKTSSVNTFQTDITYNNYCLLGLTWEWGANVEKDVNGIVGYSLASDGKLTIVKVDISYGGTNTIYITVIHD